MNATNDFNGFNDFSGFGGFGGFGRFGRFGQRGRRSVGTQGAPGFMRRGDFGLGFDLGGPRGPWGGRGGRGRGGRARRGDLRNVILLLLEEQPRHGYQLITEVGERTDNRWTPSPGTVYPTLNLLEDEGLITISNVGGRKVAELTDEGRATVEEHRAEWTRILDAYGDPEAAEGAGPGALRHELHRLVAAVRFHGRDPESFARIARILREASERIESEGTDTEGGREQAD